MTPMPKPTKRTRRRREKRSQPDGLRKYREFMKEADWLWRLIIRSMNRGRCVRCGLPVAHAMHLVSRTYHQTRWDWWTPNGAPGCAGCHFLTGRDQHEHVLMVEKWIGKAKWEQLNIRKHTKGKIDQKLIIIALEGEARNRGLIK